MIVQEGSNYKFKMASMRDDIVELIVQEGPSLWRVSEVISMQDGGAPYGEGSN